MSDLPKFLEKLHREANRAWAAAAADLGLSLSEFQYLSAVQEQADLLRYEDKHGQHLQDIVDALGVTKASASTMIAKLQDRGLVDRFQCKMDARAQHIILTEQGQILRAKGTRLYADLAQRLRDDLKQILMAAG